MLITTDVLLSSRFMNCNGRWIAVITDDILSSRFEDCGGEQPNSFGLCGDLCGIIVNLHKRHHSFGSGFSSDITSDGPVGNVADNWWVRWKLATRKLRRLSGRERQGCLRFLEERAKLPKEKDNQQPLEKGTEAASSLLLAVIEETRVLSPVSQVLLGANISPSTSDFAQSNGSSLSKKQERAIAARRWFEIRHKKIKSAGANSPTQLESTVDGAVVVCSASVSTERLPCRSLSANASPWIPGEGLATESGRSSILVEKEESVKFTSHVGPVGSSRQTKTKTARGLGRRSIAKSVEKKEGAMTSASRDSFFSTVSSFTPVNQSEDAARKATATKVSSAISVKVPEKGDAKERPLVKVREGDRVKCSPACSAQRGWTPGDTIGEVVAVRNFFSGEAARATFVGVRAPTGMTYWLDQEDVEPEISPQARTVGTQFEARKQEQHLTKDGGGGAMRASAAGASTIETVAAKDELSFPVRAGSSSKAKAARVDKKIAVSSTTTGGVQSPLRVSKGEGHLVEVTQAAVESLSAPTPLEANLPAAAAAVPNSLAATTRAEAEALLTIGYEQRRCSQSLSLVLKEVEQLKAELAERKSDVKICLMEGRVSAENQSRMAERIKMALQSLAADQIASRRSTKTAARMAQEQLKTMAADVVGVKQARAAESANLSTLRLKVEAERAIWAEQLSLSNANTVALQKQVAELWDKLEQSSERELSASRTTQRQQAEHLVLVEATLLRLEKEAAESKSVEAQQMSGTAGAAPLPVMGHAEESTVDAWGVGRSTRGLSGEEEVQEDRISRRRASPLVCSLFWGGNCQRKMLCRSSYEATATPTFVSEFGGEGTDGGGENIQEQFEAARWKERSDPRKAIGCFAFFDGKCQRGESCRYLHCEAVRRKQRSDTLARCCLAFLKGDCQREESCRYLHSEEARRMHNAWNGNGR